MADDVKTTAVPEHINSDFLKKLLVAELSTTNIEIINYSSSKPTSVGDNYLSEIYRIHITYKCVGDDVNEKNISVILKAMEAQEHRDVVLESMQMHPKETDMYFNLLPELSKMAGNAFFAAKCLHAAETPLRCMVFQDLGALGYQMADRTSLLNFHHCKLVMEKIAKLHGVSVALHRNKPNIYDLYKYGMFVANSAKQIEFIYHNGFQALIKIAKTWPGFENIVTKVELIESQLYEVMLKCITPKPNDFCVLNHGDLWVNNIMFNYPEGEIEPRDVVFVDFQIAMYASPAIDLQYFMHSSVQCESFYERRNELLQIYYDQLKQTLVENEIKTIPSFDDILQDMKAKELYGLFTSAVITPLIMTHSKNTSDIGGTESLVNEEVSAKLRDACYNNGKYQMIMKKRLKYLDEIGALDNI